MKMKDVTNWLCDDWIRTIGWLFAFWSVFLSDCRISDTELEDIPTGNSNLIKPGGVDNEPQSRDHELLRSVPIVPMHKNSDNRIGTKVTGGPVV